MPNPLSSVTRYLPTHYLPSLPTRFSWRAATPAMDAPLLSETGTLPATPAVVAAENKLSTIDQLSIRTLAAGYLKLPQLPSSWRGFLSPARYSKLAGLPMEAPKFKNVDNIQLQGYWFPKPTQTEASSKTAVLGHGYCATSGNMLPLVKPYHQRGYNVFLFDFRAHGNSGGARTSLGYHEGKDIAAAVSHLKNQYGEQAKEVHYHGHSLGAAAYLMAPESLLAHPEARQTLQKDLSSAILDSSYAVINPSQDPYVTQFCTVSAPAHWYSPSQTMNPAKRWLQHLVKGFEQQSQAIMQLPKPLDQLYPAKLYRQHPDFHDKRLLVLHGKQDTRTAFQNAEDILDALTQPNPATDVPPLKHVQFQPLEADHFVTDWKPEGSTKEYKSIVRDEERYFPAMDKFLTPKQESVFKIPKAGPEASVGKKGLAPEAETTVPAE